MLFSDVAKLSPQLIALSYDFATFFIMNNQVIELNCGPLERTLFSLMIPRIDLNENYTQTLAH
jgi:hypothetical protein